VETSKYQLADKSKEVVLSKTEYEHLKALAAEPSQVGRYQMVQQGIRTWRLDTATGRSCLLLASEADWKGSANKQTSCPVDDYIAARERHAFHPFLYDDAGNPIQQPVPASQPK
jgi:hypothetical protein